MQFFLASKIRNIAILPNLEVFVPIWLAICTDLEDYYTVYTKSEPKRDFNRHIKPF